MICKKCNTQLDEVKECSGCGYFCIECYEKDADQWYHAPLEESEHHCRDLCGKCGEEKDSTMKEMIE